MRAFSMVVRLVGFLLAIITFALIFIAPAFAAQLKVFDVTKEISPYGVQHDYLTDELVFFDEQGSFYSNTADILIMQDVLEADTKAEKVKSGALDVSL